MRRPPAHSQRNATADTAQGGCERKEERLCGLLRVWRRLLCALTASAASSTAAELCGFATVLAPLAAMILDILEKKEEAEEEEAEGPADEADGVDEAATPPSTPR